jgi:hypothetical protein
MAVKQELTSFIFSTSSAIVVIPVMYNAVTPFHKGVARAITGAKENALK